jgi:hypothetical protein
LPEGSLIGILAPKAARIGSLTTKTSLAPASLAASIIALLSVEVIPQGAEIIISGLINLQLPKDLLIK